MKESIRIGKNYRICYNCIEPCDKRYENDKCDKLEKKRGLIDKWIRCNNNELIKY